jgi:hypothetical protein
MLSFRKIFDFFDLFFELHFQFGFLDASCIDLVLEIAFHSSQEIILNVPKAAGKNAKKRGLNSFRFLLDSISFAAARRSTASTLLLEHCTLL